MGKAGAGTPKAIANAIKAKGLGRLRWYCQICEKQCRDENGFQAHTRSEPHMRKMLLVGPKAGQTIAEFSRQFQYEFVSLLRTRHQTNRVRSNAVYNEYIQDKHHVHMNSTRWVTLNGFVMTLGKAGIIKVDEDEKGIWIQWIDNSPKTLAKQAALQKRDRADMDGEERERYLLDHQIQRAQAMAAEKGDIQEGGLQKKEGEKITLSLFGNTDQAKIEGSSSPKDEVDTKPDISTNAEAGPSTTTPPEEAKPAISFGTINKPSAPTPTANPLKRPAPVNVFKQAKSAKTESDAMSSMGGSKKGYMSESERLMKEDQARNLNKGQGQGYGGFGPQRAGPPGGGRKFVLQ